MAVPVSESSASTSLDTWMAQWQEAALATPCGSCTGRACTVCSIRVGGSSNADGTPSGYAPKVLEYYNTANSTPAEFAPFTLDLTAMAAQGSSANASTSNNGTAAAPETFLAAQGGTTDTSTSSNGTTAAPATLAVPAAAQAASNPIVLENMKPGTPEDVWLFRAETHSKPERERGDERYA